MTTIRDYAKEHHVSYEAIRSQVSRYRKELEGHIITQGKTKYLDDFAVDFLDGKRKENPVIVVREGDQGEAKLLRDQIEALKNELLSTQKRVIDLQTENQLMIEAKTKYDLLVESSAGKDALIETLRDDLSESRKASEQLRKEVDEAKERSEKLEAERDTAEKEANSYRKSIFGFYRKISK